MPFLAPLALPVAGGLVSAGAGALINKLSSGAQSDPTLSTTTAPVTGAIDQQQALVNALSQANGIQNQSQVFNQLGQVAQGQGPNPAQQMLAQATGQNVAQQAALAASQRGASANAGLIARQAAQAGAGVQQQAANQAAVLQANQSLNALGQQGQIAGNQVNQQLQGNGQLASTALNNQQQLFGAQQNVNNIHNQQGLQQAQDINKMGVGAANGLSEALGVSSTPDDTEDEGVQKKAEGGEIQSPQMGMNAIKKENYAGRSKLGPLLMAKGGKIHNMKTGGHVPGKAKVKGAKDSYSNDNVPALLSPGEIVLPRSVTQSANPTDAAAKFVAAIKAKKSK